MGEISSVVFVRKMRLVNDSEYVNGTMKIGGKRYERKSSTMWSYI